MLLWRISNHVDLSGLGGELLDGRWHTAAPAKRIVYVSEHPALALIENLANLRGDPRFFQRHFQLMKIVGPDALRGMDLLPEQTSTVARRDPMLTQAIGDAWLAARGSALLRVPSIPSPESWNYLLNPLHPDAVELRVEWARPISYDRRLFHLADA